MLWEAQLHLTNSCVCKDKLDLDCLKVLKLAADVDIQISELLMRIWVRVIAWNSFY